MSSNQRCGNCGSADIGSMAAHFVCHNCGAINTFGPDGEVVLKFEDRVGKTATTDEHGRRVADGLNVHDPGVPHGIDHGVPDTAKNRKGMLEATRGLQLAAKGLLEEANRDEERKAIEAGELDGDDEIKEAEKESKAAAKTPAKAGSSKSD